MPEKQCARCEAAKPLEDFRWLHRHNRGKHERFRDAWCVECRRAYKRTRTQLDKANERLRVRRETDPEFREAGRVRSASYYNLNREKVLASMRAKGAAGGWLNNRLRKKFGIDLLEYQRLSDEQDGRCKLCGQEERTRQRRLAVDHCHATGRVRGLLCHHCNTGLGNFRDDLDLLRKAIDYLGAN